MAHKDVFAFILLFIVMIDTCDCGDIIAENIMEELANLKTALQHQISYTNRLETMISTQKQTIEILHGTIETLNDKFETLNGKMGELKSSTKEDHKEKRLLSSSLTPSPVPMHPTAFYAYLSHKEVAPGQHQTVIFDTVKTNVNNGYSQHTGVFTADASGLYVFTFNIRIMGDAYGAYEIMRNSDREGVAVGVINGTNQNQITCTIVIHVDVNDKIYVRTHETLTHIGAIGSDGNGWTMFAGWQISN